MQKTINAILVAGTVAVAASVSAAPLATESFRGLAAGPVQPDGIVGGAADIDAAGVYRVVNYASTRVNVVDDEATDAPFDLFGSDGKYLTTSGDADVFFRVVNTATLPSSAAIADTAPNANVAFAFRLNSIDATAANNDADLWRIMGVAATGGSSNIATVSIIDGALVAQTNGLGTVPDIVGDITTLTIGRWYVLTLSYSRAAAAGGSVTIKLIDSTTGVVAGSSTATGLTSANVDGIAAIATGATLDVPSGSAAIVVSLDDFTAYSSSLSAAQLETEVRSTYALPSSVEDWMNF